MSNTYRSSKLLKRSLTEAEAAHYLSVSRSFLRHSRSRGETLQNAPYPPYIKQGRMIRYLIEDLDQFLDELREPSVQRDK